MSRYCHVFHALTLMSPASKRQLQQALLVYMLGDSHIIAMLSLEQLTNLREVSQCPEKVPTWTFSLLKEPTSTFKLRILLTVRVG